MRENFSTLFARLLNGLELLTILVILLMAFTLQLVWYELPCPLCLLQRIGFSGIAFGILLNLWYGLRPSHYAIILYSALFTSFVALRQISLHILPSSGGYGMPFLGLHLYTWCFIFAMLVMIGTTFILSLDHQYQKHLSEQRKPLRWLGNVLAGIFTLLLIINIIAIFMECGLTQCPDNPTKYLAALQNKLTNANLPYTASNY